MSSLSSIVAGLVACTLCLSSFSATASSPQSHHTVFWISVDGLRPDYLERAETPFFDRLKAEGAHSDHIWPVFPSVTFASHVSQATGTKPEVHGITGNSFYDSRTQNIYRYPGDAALLEAEPIWITASRQGIRTSLLDWPLSHNQQGPVTTAYFGQSYTRGISDQDRLNRLLDTWENDDHEQPLQLLLGYMESPDSDGHRYGPDAPEVTTAVERVDQILGQAYERAHRIWRNQNPTPDAQLFFILSSDHGMSQVHTLVHPGNLTGLEGRDDLRIMTTGNVGHVHLDRMESDAERETLIEQTLARLTEFDYLQAFRREAIPEDWGLRHPYRTGDILLILDTGYTFSRRPGDIEQSASEGGGPLGMHGYDPAINPEMLTPLIIHRTPDLLGGETFGQAMSIQLHATICQILGIDPAPGAVAEPIEWQPAVPAAP
jgi:hypothetical protein